MSSIKMKNALKQLRSSILSVLPWWWFKVLQKIYSIFKSASDTTLLNFLNCLVLVINIIISPESLTYAPSKGCDLATCWGWCKVSDSTGPRAFCNFDVLISFPGILFIAHCFGGFFLFFSPLTFWNLFLKTRK